MSRLRRRLAAHALGLALASTSIVAVPLAAAAAPPSGSTVSAPGAQALQNRLLAPCCWNQTLDIPESAVATALRAAIDRRLLAGEAAAVIEDDIVARYGERIRAMPTGREPLHHLAAVLAGGTALAAVGLFFVVRRWRAPRSERANDDATRAPERDDYDARLDAELEG